MMADKYADTMTPPLDLADMGGSITKLIECVVRANLRATQELLRVENREEFLELQQRFVREYLATLMQGTMAVVKAIPSD
jgi:hypothetical protein